MAKFGCPLKWSSVCTSPAIQGSQLASRSFAGSLSPPPFLGCLASFVLLSFWASANDVHRELMELLHPYLIFPHKVRSPYCWHNDQVLPVPLCMGRHLCSPQLCLCFKTPICPIYRWHSLARSSSLPTTIPLLGAGDPCSSEGRDRS